MEKTILLVDDNPIVLESIIKCLSPYYEIRVANEGRKGLSLAHLIPLPDLILLDVELPDMTGFELCGILKRDIETREIPVIFLSSHGEEDKILRGLELGAVDYVAKPVAPPILLARVRTHLRLREANDLLRDQNNHLETLVRERTHDLEKVNQHLENSRFDIINHLGRAAEYRDNETGMHILRVGNLSRLLGMASGFSEEKAHMLKHASMMHDIGKIGIPDDVLLKPGKLTAAEFDVIKMHPVIGAKIIGNPAADPLLMAKEIALTHHEKWDGSGYPNGLKMEAIPLVGRIVCIADVFDALTSMRPYKAPWPIDKAFGYIAEYAGQHFDPTLAKLFIEHADDVLSVITLYADENVPPVPSSGFSPYVAGKYLPLPQARLN